jgi:hypothetical protein
MTACHCYLWWRWWSDIMWATLIRLWLHSLWCHLQIVVKFSMQLHRYVLHSVFLSSELSPDFYFSKGQLPLKWLNHLKLLENWFFCGGCHHIYLYWLQLKSCQLSCNLPRDACHPSSIRKLKKKTVVLHPSSHGWCVERIGSGCRSPHYSLCSLFMTFVFIGNMLLFMVPEQVRDCHCCSYC